MKKKILYLSSPSFADCDFPLIKALQQLGHDVTYMIMLAPYNLRSTLCDIKRQINVNDIIPALKYPELRVYEKYMDKDDTYKHDYALDGNLTIEMAAVYLGELIKTKGSVKTYSEQFKAFTTGKSEHLDNEERLFVCKCN